MRYRLRRYIVAFVDDTEFLVDLFARGGADRLAAFHLMVELRAGERHHTAGSDDLKSVAVPHRVGGVKQVGVEACAARNVSAASAAVAEMHGRAVVRMALDGEQ